MQVKQIYISLMDSGTYQKRIGDMIAKYKPDLFIVLSSYNYPVQNVLDYISTFNIPIVGGTTSDVMVKTKLLHKSVVITAVKFTKSKFKIFLAKKDDILDKKKFSMFIQNFIDSGVPKLIFSFISYINFFEIEAKFELLNRINMNYNILGFGGIMGGNQGNKNKFIFYNNSILENALAYVAVYNDNLKTEIFSLHGYNPIGPTFVITKVNKNKICHINNKPALDFYLDFYGPLLKKKKDILKYPIGILNRNNNIDFLRAFVDYDEKEKSLITRGRVFENMKFKLLISSPDEMINDIKNKLRNFVESLKLRPDICFIVECNGRRSFLNENLIRENRIITKILKDVEAIIGFFSSGEIFGKEMEKGKSYKTIFLNNTINFLLVKE